MFGKEDFDGQQSADTHAPSMKEEHEHGLKPKRPSLDSLAAAVGPLKFEELYEH